MFLFFFYTAQNAYYLKDSAIQKDVIAYGPIEASFDVYDDFPNYESGVYTLHWETNSLVN